MKWVELLASVVLVAAVAGLANLPLPASPREGVLRLSWSTVGARVKVVLAQADDVPEHMRPPEGASEWRLLPYRLELNVDGSLLLNEVVEPSGARHDRPLVVHREIALPPGEHAVSISFMPAGEAPPDAARLTFRGTARVRAGRAALVTLDPAESQLTMLGGTD